MTWSAARSDGCFSRPGSNRPVSSQLYWRNYVLLLHSSSRSCDRLHSATEVTFLPLSSFPSFIWPVYILGFVADHLWLTSANPSQSWLPRNQTLAMLLTSSFDTFIAIHHDATSNPPASSASPPPQAAFLFINEVRHRFSRVLRRIASQVFSSCLSRYKSAFLLKIFHTLFIALRALSRFIPPALLLFVFLVTSSQRCHP